MSSCVRNPRRRLPCWCASDISLAVYLAVDGPEAGRLFPCCCLSDSEAIERPIGGTQKATERSVSVGSMEKRVMHSNWGENYPQISQGAGRVLPPVL